MIFGLLLAAFLGVIYWVLLKFCKYGKPIKNSYIEVLKKSGFKGWNIKINFIYLISVITSMLLLYTAIAEVFPALINNLYNHDTRYLVWNINTPMFVASIIFSLYVGQKFSSFLGQKLGKVNYARYMLAISIYYKIDIRSVDKYILKMIKYLSFIGFISGSLIHGTIKNDQFSILPFLAFEKVKYNLATATNLTIYANIRARSGKIVEAENLVIDFTDGRQFKSGGSSFFIAGKNSNLLKLSEADRVFLAEMVEKNSHISRTFSNSAP